MSDMKSNSIGPNMTLGTIVTQFPGVAPQLEKLGLDYCCHGERTLKDAANEAGLDVEEIAKELTSQNGGKTSEQWAQMDPSQLVDHIENIHHKYLWEELPRITALVDKIVSVHGANHSELFKVQSIFNTLRADFEPHLTIEEEQLFPKIRELYSSNKDAKTDSPQVRNQISELVLEHETVGELLEQLREVTSNFQTPPDGCATYAQCYSALSTLESDTHLHVHKENNVLFPTVLA